MENLRQSSLIDSNQFPRKRAEDAFEDAFAKTYKENQIKKAKSSFGNFYNWLFNREGKSEGAPYIALPTLAVGVICGSIASAAAFVRGDLETALGTSVYTLSATSALAAMYDADTPGTWLYNNFGGAGRTGRHKHD